MKHTVTEHKLKSGAKGLIINVPDSAVINILVRFNSGYQFTDPERYEVPHVMEHVLANISQKYPGPNEFNIEVAKNGAYINANTSASFNGYVYESAAFELDRILDLLEEQLVRPLFDPASVKSELGNVREELTRITTQHGSVCNIRFGERAYPDQIKDYDSRIAQLPNIEAKHLEAHYRKTHTAANARFFVAGTFADGGQAVTARLEQLFSQLPRGERLRPSEAIGRHFDQPVVIKRDIQQLYYTFEVFGEELTHQERRAMTMLRLILGGGKASRVFGEARRRGLAYQVSVGGSADPGNSSFGFGGYVTPTNAIELFKLFTRAYAAMAADGPTVAELEAARNLGIGSTQRSYQRGGDMVSWYLGAYDTKEEIIDFDTYLEELKQVTPAQIKAVAQKLTALHRSGFSVLGEVDEFKAAEYAAILKPIWAQA